MADHLVHDLPDSVIDVLSRRARAAGLELPEQIRHELVTLARRRTADDTIVAFLDAEGRDLEPELDSEAVTFADRYRLPAQSLLVLGRRARAVGMPLGQYLRRELVALARQTTIEDALLELDEVRQCAPEMAIDMAAAAAAVRYARGL